MEEISITINGVRYDGVHNSDLHSCRSCELRKLCDNGDFYNQTICEKFNITPSAIIFKKSMTIANETKAIRLLERLLETICEATSSVEKEDTDAGLCVMTNFWFDPTFEFYEDDIKTIKWLQEENEGRLDFSQLTE